MVRISCLPWRSSKAIFQRKDADQPMAGAGLPLVELLSE